jgi:transketolase
VLNSEAKLNAKMFHKSVELLPTRNGYGEGVVAAGEADPNVVVLCADLTESTRSQGFAEKFPHRFIELGVAEQNLAAIAAGLGISGKVPFISSYATFSPGRNWEQIRTTIAYNDSNVKIIGSHTGVSVGPDGATHQATEDMAIMRTMPNMRVFSPCDAIEARKVTEAVAQIWGPCYVRFAREKSPIITTEETPFRPGKAEIFWSDDKPEVVVIACGPLVYNALLAAKELLKEVKVMVVNCHTIKPLDDHLLLEVIKECGAVVTVEEHQVKGGLGGAVAELVAREHPVPIEFIGMQDTFGETGAPEELIEKYGMGSKSIKEAIKKVVKRK